MSKEPLYPHVPRGKQPLFPHVPGGRGPSEYMSATEDLGWSICGQCGQRFHSDKEHIEHLRLYHPTAYNSVLRGGDKQTLQLEKLENRGGYKVIQVHDDGDVTVESGGTSFVVTTGGDVFSYYSGEEALKKTTEYVAGDTVFKKSGNGDLPPSKMSPMTVEDGEPVSPEYRHLASLVREPLPKEAE